MQAQMQEKVVIWDRQMEEHACWLQRDNAADEELKISPDVGELRLTKTGSKKRVFSRLPEKEKKLPTRNTPPKGPRLEMKPRQVKPPDRNAAAHSFYVDAMPRNTNPYSVRWGDSFECVKFMGLSVPLWGSPSKRHREIKRLKERLPEDQQLGSRHQATLRYNRGRYHILVHRSFVEPPKRASDPHRLVNAVALDPGIRTMFGLHDTSGHFGEIGEGQIGRIIRVAKRSDQVKSRLDTKLKDKDHRDHNSAKRKRARRRMRQIAAKCRDLKSDAHWQTAKALCERYDDVMIPRFHCSAMMRFLNRTSVRQLMNWGHFEFRERLKQKAQELGVRIHEVKESYSTITCSRCHWIEDSFRRNTSKLFRCHGCGHDIDRDRNGAYNIGLMNLERCVGRVEPRT